MYETTRDSSKSRYLALPGGGAGFVRRVFKLLRRAVVGLQHAYMYMYVARYTRPRTLQECVHVMYVTNDDMMNYIHV